MPRRRDALTKIDTALKNLAKQVPGGSELATILTGIVDGKEHYRPAVLDRTCAIACSAALWMRTAAIWMRVQCRDGTMIVAA